MNNNYGRLLEYAKQEKHEDPYKGYKVVRRGGTTNTEGYYEFEAPEENNLLKLKDSRFLYELELESNIIPDNDVCARMIKSIDIEVNNGKVTFSMDKKETAFLVQYSTLLNFNREAQESELFLQGHYDTTTFDYEELMKWKVLYSGKNVPEHRQSFAHAFWVDDSDQYIALADNKRISFKKKIFKWRVRAPIPHGLAKQPKVIPVDTRVVIQVFVKEPHSFLISCDDYMEVRISKTDYDSIVFPVVEQKLAIEEMVNIKHATFGECDCKTVKNLKSMEQIVGVKSPKDDVSTTLELKKTNWIVDGAFTPHTATYDTLKSKKYKNEKGEVDDDYMIVFYKNQMKTNPKNVLKNFELEANLIDSPRKIESPLIVSKGICRIPFYSNKLSPSSFAPGAQNYDLRITSGRLPHMVIFTGQSQIRYASDNARDCVVKTSLYEPGYEIEEFTILIDDYPVMGTPWTTPEQFYENYLRQIGRLDNYANSGSIDFFQFQQYSWMVPMHFDEHDNLTGSLSVRIRFKAPLTKAWKPMFMTFTSIDVEIDTPKRSEIIENSYKFYSLTL